MAITGREVRLRHPGFAGQGQIEGRFIHILDTDRERFSRTFPLAVSRGDRDVNTVNLFVVQADALSELQLAINHFKAIIRHGVSDRITRIRIVR